MNDSATITPVRKRRGCLFYGCLTSLVLLLIAAVLILFGIRYAKGRLNAYTDTEPMKLPKVEMADADFQILKDRVTAFSDALEQGKPVEPLTLTERDINALIAKSANMKEFADKFYVLVNGSEVTGQVSIPLSGLGWLGKGRYLNGEATFNVSLENGVLIVTAREVKVKGKPLPETFMTALRKENLAKDAYKDPENAKTIQKLESIQVQESQVLIKAREVK